MSALTQHTAVGVIGAGTMGAGIAQVAAAAGHTVLLFDAMDGAADRGRQRIAKGLDGLVAKQRMGRSEADDLIANIQIISEIGQFASAGLVIEAIVENLEIKQNLIAQLEAIVAPDAIIATNTSSISVTAIACKAASPSRIAGLHFFNPAPVMKLVEIVSGIATAPGVAETLHDTARAWGKIPVHAKSTPGFIVNRVARPYYAEALRLFEEQVANPATLDAILSEGAGFRMGPFALMDLIGHDVNYSVSLSVFNAYYQEPRFRPAIAQLELVNAGRLGRKTGIGFYDYAADAVMPQPDTVAVQEGAEPLDPAVFQVSSEVDGVLIRRTDGRTAAEHSKVAGTPALLYDLVAETGATRIAFAATPDVPPYFIDRFVAAAHQQGMAATRLPDWPGLVAMRTVAMLANEAFEAMMQGVGTAEAIDNAMRFGVNYPRGPVEWAQAIGLSEIVSTLDSLLRLTGDPRYRCSLGLRLGAAR